MKRVFVLLICGLLLGSLRLNAQGAPGNPVHMVVTVEPKSGVSVPDIAQENVAVYQATEQRPTTSWLPLRGNSAALELFILIDEGSNTSLEGQLEDVRQFILAQPASTLIGVAYMRNGAVQIPQDLTKDHQQAAKAVRSPIGDRGINSNPYITLVDLINRWPKSNARHEVLMITDGMDRLWVGAGVDDPYVDAAVAEAEKSGTIIFSIYTPGVGHYSHSYWRTNLGQTLLSRLCDLAGGESYYGGNTPVVSLNPYLEDLARKLEHQYLLTFSARPSGKADLQKVRLRTEVPNVELVSADAVYIPTGDK